VRGVSKVRKNQKGFSIIAALSLAVVLGVGAMFLGKILSYLKLTKLKTQARLSTLGYEDAMAKEIARAVYRNLVNRTDNECRGGKADLGIVQIPGSNVNIEFNSEMKPSNMTGDTSTLILDTEINSLLKPGAAAASATASERFIDNYAKITFRVELLDKDMSQNEKMFGSGKRCADFRTVVPNARKQMKIVTVIEWEFRGKKIYSSQTQMINLEEARIV